MLAEARPRATLADPQPSKEPQDSSPTGHPLPCTFEAALARAAELHRGADDLRIGKEESRRSVHMLGSMLRE